MRRKIIKNFSGKEIAATIDCDIMLYVDGRLLTPEVDYRFKWKHNVRMIEFMLNQNNVTIQVVSFNYV